MANLLTTSTKYSETFDYDRLMKVFAVSMTQNIPILGGEYTKIGVLSSYSQHLLRLKMKNKMDKQLEKQVKKLFRCYEYEVNFNDLAINEVVDLLLAFSQVKVGTVDFFLEIEKKIGVNIDQIDPKLYVSILNSMIRSGKFREKFLLLVLKKTLDNFDKMEREKLVDILRMCSLIEIGIDLPFRQLEPIFLEEYKQYSLSTLSNLMFAYSNPKLKEKYHLVNDIEQAVVDKIEEGNTRIWIDIWNTYLTTDKGEKSTHTLLKEKILASDPAELSSVDLKRLTECLVRANVSAEQAEPVLSALADKANSLSDDETVSLVRILDGSVFSSHSVIPVLRERISVSNKI